MITRTLILPPAFLLFLFALPIYASSGAENKPEQDTKTGDARTQKSRQPSIPREEYALLQQKITYGKANMEEVYRALSERKDIAALTNTMHALYSMRSHRPVYRLLNDLWELNKEKHPNLPFELFAKPPVRIALASTINRIKIFNAQEYKKYIRSHKDDEHEFHRAQVAIALGLNGDPVDVPYLKAAANEKNIYVSQTAITALSLMNANQARNAMIELWENDKESDRAELLLQLLYKAYKWTPLSAAAAKK